MSSALFYPHRTAGIFTAIASYFCFSASDVLVKHLIATYSLFQILPFTSVIALTLIVAYAYYGPGAAFNFKRSRMRLATHYSVRQIVRGLLGATSGFCAYQAYKGLPLANVYLISFMAPVILALAAQVFFKEHAGARIWLAILVGFAGVLVVLQPDTFPLSIYTLLAVISVLTYCCNVLLARTMPKDDVLVFPFYTQIMVLLTTFIPGVLVWQGFGWVDVIFLIAAGLAIAAASILFFSAYRLAPTAVVAPFEYTQLIWGISAGYLFFNTVPTLNFALGAALIVGAGSFLMLASRPRLNKVAVATAN